MKTILLFISLFITVASFAQVRLVGTTGGWSTVDANTYTATFTRQTDLTGNSFTCNDIESGFRIVSGTASNGIETALKMYEVTAIANPTSSTIDLTVDEYGATQGAPTGLVFIYDPDGRMTIPQVPTGTTGSTAALQAAIDTYNARYQYTVKLTNGTPSGAPAANTPEIAQDTSSGGGNELWRWNGSAWVSVTGISDGDKGDVTVSSSGTVINIDASAVGTNEIADASVSLADIGANQIDSTKVVPGGIGNTDLQNGIVGSSKVTDASLLYVDLAQSLKDTIATQVDNVSSLLSLTAARTGTIVSTRRFSTSTKLGGSNYLIVADTAGFWLPNDTASVVRISDGRFAVLNVSGGEVTVEQFGAIGGTGLTQAQRVANWKAFKKAAIYANRMGKKPTLGQIKTEYEVHVNDGDGFTSANNLNLNFDLRGGTLRYFPRVQTYHEVIWDINGNSNVGFSNGAIITAEPSLETYTATIKPGGTANSIVITSSDIRAAFAAQIVGQTILVSYDYDQEADTAYVTAYNAGTKTLTLAQNVNLPSATSDDAGWIGLVWSASQVQDTIDRYKGYWLRFDGSSEVGFNFIDYMPADSTNSGSITMKNISTRGFYGFVSKSTGDIDITIEDCFDLRAHSGLVSSFSDDVTDSRVVLKNSHVHNTGFESKGQYPGHSQSEGDRWNGGAFYCHPNISLEFDNVLFDSCVAAIRSYSSSGAKPLDRKFINSFKNCEFRNMLESYHVFASQQVPTVFQGCTFTHGQIHARNDVTFQDCVFDSAFISSLSTDNTFTRLRFNGGEWKNGTVVGASGNIRETLTLSNVQAEAIGNSSNGVSYQFANLFDTVIIENCVFRPNSSGTSATAFFQYVPTFFNFNNSIFGLSGHSFFHRNTYPAAKDGHRFSDVTIYNGSVSGMNQLSTTYRQFTVYGLKGTFSSTFPSCSEIPFPEIPYPVTLTTSSISITNPIQVIVPPTTTAWLASNEYNHFFLNGTGKGLRFTGSSYAIQTDKRGLVTLTARGGSVTIPAYNAATVDSTSNFTQAVSLTDGQSQSFYFDNTAMVYDQAVTDLDTLGTWIASATEAQYWELIEDEQWWGLAADREYSGYRIIPGTVSIYIGSDTLTDASRDGVLTSTEGTGATGFIGYYHNYVYLKFTSAPSTGAVVKIAYQYANVIHHIGMFRPTSPPTTAPTLAGVSSVSTDAAKSVYTMSAGVPVEVKSSDNNNLLYLDETDEEVGFGVNPQYTMHLQRSGNVTPMFESTAGVVTQRLNGGIQANIAMRDGNATTNEKVFYLRNDGGYFKLLSLNDAESAFVNQNILVGSHAGLVGFNTANPRRRVDILDSNPQLRLSLTDNAVYGEFLVGTNGNTSLDLVGTSPEFTFLDAVNVPDFAYDATTWNGNTELPTMNAIRDFLEGGTFLKQGANTLTQNTTFNGAFDFRFGNSTALDTVEVVAARWLGGTATSRWSIGSDFSRLYSAGTIAYQVNNSNLVHSVIIGDNQSTAYQVTISGGNTAVAVKSTDGDEQLTLGAATMPVSIAQELKMNKTVTAAATTGAQTINKPAGTVNFAAAATSLVVTNSLVTTSSIILCTIGTNDATMTSVQAVAGSGSFTIHANAAATAETRVNFLVIN